MRARRGHTPTASSAEGGGTPLKSSKMRSKWRWRHLITVACCVFALLILLGAVTFSVVDSFGVRVTELVMHVVMPRPQFYSQLSQDPEHAFRSVEALLDDGFRHLDQLEVFGVSTFSTLQTDSEHSLKTLVKDKQQLCELLKVVLVAVTSPRADQDARLVDSFCKLANSTRDTFFYFHRPSLTKYGPYQWLWDSCFHIMISTRRSIIPAALELFSLFTFQHATGFVPEMTYWHADPNQGGIGGFLFGYSDERFTDITQMPMLTYPVEQLHRMLAELPITTNVDMGDAFARIFFRRAARYIEYWYVHRDPDSDGLVSIIHPWESGLDASPLYDDVHYGSDSFSAPPLPEELYPKFVVLLYRYRHQLKWDLGAIQAHPNRFDVEDIGVNSVLLDNSFLMSQLSHISVNHFAHSAMDRILGAKRAEPASLVSFGWSPSKNKKITLRAKTVQRLLVLLVTFDSALARPKDDQWIQSVLMTERSLLDDLSDSNHFALPFGVPTAAKSERSFDRHDSSLMWRGPTWPTTNWFVVRALTEVVDRDCGALEDHAPSCRSNQEYAELILVKLISSWLQLHTLHGFSEYFDPISGEPLGQRNLGMSMAILDFLGPLVAPQPAVSCGTCRSWRHGDKARSLSLWKEVIKRAFIP